MHLTSHFRYVEWCKSVKSKSLTFPTSVTTVTQMQIQTQNLNMHYLYEFSCSKVACCSNDGLFRFLHFEVKVFY